MVSRLCAAATLVTACALPVPAYSTDVVAAFLKDKPLLSRLDADVTGDNVLDAVVVTASPDSLQATVTVFRQQHGKTVVGTGTMSGYEGVDSLQVELTPLGPPTVKAAKGGLIVESLTGGATVRTAATYRYRFDADEGRMRLIGLDAERTSTTLGVRLSWNVVTGTHVVRRGQPDGGGFRYGAETRSTYKMGTIYMSLTPSPEELLDRALGLKQ